MAEKPFHFNVINQTELPLSPLTVSVISFEETVISIGPAGVIYSDFATMPGRYSVSWRKLPAVKA